MVCAEVDWGLGRIRRRLQHVVGALEALVHLGIIAHDFEQLVIEHHNQRVDIVFK